VDHSLWKMVEVCRGLDCTLDWNGKWTAVDLGLEWTIYRSRPRTGEWNIECGPWTGLHNELECMVDWNELWSVQCIGVDSSVDCSSP